MILGTSNRAILEDQSGTTGPRDIIDLATGSTLGTVPDGLGANLSFWMRPVWDGSGDVIWMQPERDSAGTTTALDVQRVDPRDMTSPKWKTRVAAVGAGQPDIGFASTGRVPFSYQSPTGGERTALLDLGTGELTGDAPAHSYQNGSDTVLVQYGDFVNGQPTTASGMDRQTGATLWTKPYETGASISELLSGRSRPGGPLEAGREVPTGDLVLVTTKRLTLFDGTSGAVEMTADVSHCNIQPWDWANGGRDIEFDQPRDSVVILQQEDRTCSVSRETGAPTPLADPAWPGPPVFGPAVTYFDEFKEGADGVGIAYDRRGGRRLWTIPVKSSEQWLFAGGTLIREADGHIESIG